MRLGPTAQAQMEFVLVEMANGAVKRMVTRLIVVLGGFFSASEAKPYSNHSSLCLLDQQYRYLLLESVRLNKQAPLLINQSAQYHKAPSAS